MGYSAMLMASRLRELGSFHRAISLLMWVLMSDYETMSSSFRRQRSFTICIFPIKNWRCSWFFFGLVSPYHHLTTSKGGGGCIQSCDVNALTWPFANELISWAMVTGHKYRGVASCLGRRYHNDNVIILCLQTLRVIWMKLRETPWNSEKVSQTSIQQLHASSVFISAKLSDLQVRCSCMWAALQTGWRVLGQGGSEGAHN